MKTTTPKKQDAGTGKKTAAVKHRKSGGNPDSQTFSDDPAIVDQALKDQLQHKTPRANRTGSKK